MNLKRYIIVLACAAMPMVASAQALPFTAVNHNPVSLGMAGASSADLSSSVSSAFADPASAGFYTGKAELQIADVIWQPSTVKVNVAYLSGVYKVGKNVAVSAGFSYGIHQEYEVVNQSGVSTGTFKPSDMHVSAGFAWRFLPFLSLGANVGYASSKLAAGSSYGTVVMDAALMARLGGFRVSLGLSDLGGKVASASGKKFSLPTSVALGVGYDLSFAEKHCLNFNVDADYYLDGAFAAGGGMTYSYGDMAFVRAGYHYGADSVIPSFASVGVGVKVVGITVDLSYLIGNSPMANTIGVSLGYAF